MAAGDHNPVVRRGVLIVLILLLVASPATRAQSPGAPGPSPARGYIESVLTCERVPLSLRETPLGDLVRTLQDTLWVNVVLDPGVDRSRTVTYQADPPPPLGAALATILGPLELTATVWCDVLLIHPVDTPPPAEPTTTLTGALDVYSVQHTVVPFTDALLSLGDLSDVRYELTSAARERVRGATVSLRVRNLPLHHLLTLIAAHVGLRWTPDGGVVWLHEAGEDLAAVQAGVLERQAAVRVTASFAAAPLEEVASSLRALTGVELRLGADLPGELSVSLRVTDVGLAEALDALARPHGLTWRREGTSIVLVKP